MTIQFNVPTLAKVLACICLSVVSGAAAAQQGNPAGMTPSSQRPAPAPEPNTADRLFVQLAGQGGLAEVQMARLANTKAGHSAVKDFAQRMVDDHSRANARLEQTARQAGLPLPTQPAPDQRAMHERLSALSGPAFDQAYLRNQLVEHQKTVQLLQWHMGSGQTAPLQQFAAETLPTVLDHLAHVRQLIEQAP
jgi:putative membrane protein